MKKKILFITPTLGRTGSEMVLWYLLNNIDRSKFDPFVFSLKKGELYDQLPSGIQKSVSYKHSGIWYKKIFRGILKALSIDPISYQLKQIQKKLNANVWYVNTITIPQVYAASKKETCNIVTHVHEHMFAYGYIKSEEFKSIIEGSKYLIGCSNLVCEAMRKLGHPNVLLQNSFINDKQIRPSEQRIKELKDKHQIGHEDFVFVVSGYLSYMKGVDIVLHIAEHFKGRPVKILWMGGSFNNGLNYYVNTVAEQPGNENLIFLGSIAEDYYNYFAMANAYLSLSREECLSLAMLEAAVLGKPIISFNTGIAKDFIKSGMGTVVDGFNAEDMILAMEQHLQDSEISVEMLKKSAAEYTIENQRLKFDALLTAIS